MSRAHIFRRLSTSAVLSAALAGAVALAGLGGNLTTGAQHQSLGGHVQLASATEPTDGMSFDMTNVDADQYDAIINFLRERAGGWSIYQNIRVTRTKDDYFPLTLSVGQSRITLIFNARNLYVTGWYNEQTHQYVRLGDGPGGMPGQNGRTDERNWLNYSRMEAAAGVDRGSLGITMGAIQGAISDLARGNSRDQARALLVLVQAFAEGARFDFISYRIGHAMRNSGIFYAGSSSFINGGSGAIELTSMDLENNWGGLSDAAENSTQNHVPLNYHIGSGSFTSMQALDEQLALALYIFKK
ncbi:ribosome-inactivating family protein [Streptomyces neyagawaensis]|uniref:ribosome-inactivating family protein n=1 Tax=Streptomyces neyagawaensis TaxID=42238 RepID=UPI0006E31735|nr:ribosome-inactivating family protein [Streptomyces neyagawaensis]MCL6735017.1 ribosome-inactivating family protein [Streptomyces neyagawaensis]MDE1684715.1 ribosome-inactivating family protein [Streptomyces neyagawaensis]